MPLRLVNNVVWGIFSQVGGLLIPLIELPILARALGQQMYGQVLYVLSIALTASVFVEFGFSFSASRQVIKVKDDRQALAQLITDVFLAKLLLSMLVGVVLSVWLWGSSSASIITDRWLLWIAAFTVSFGFSPIWYYIGIGNLKLPALFDLGIRSIGLGAIVLSVSAPQHAERVLAIQAVVGMVNTLVPSLLMIRSTGLGRLSFQGAKDVLQESWTLFLYKGAQNIIGSMASTLLGSLSTPQAVGAFAPAEKLVRAASSLVMPVLNAVFPKAVELQIAKKVVKKKLLVGILVLLLIGILLFSGLIVWMAPLIIQKIFGLEFQAAIPVLRGLVWIIPLRAFNLILTMLWLIPRGAERIAAQALLMNFVVICVFAVVLVPRLGSLGMAIALLVAEAMLCIILFWRKLN
ncbi:MAG: oligosaccharide flippase family protein [Candidatus Symbiodolus clandestinus]